MDSKAAASVVLNGGLAAITGTPLPLVLLQVVSGLSRLVTPDDVAAAAKGLEEGGEFAGAAILRAIHALGSIRTASPEPSQQLSGGPSPAFTLPVLQEGPAPDPGV